VSYRIDVSTNLPDWEPLFTLPGAGTNQHVDTATPYFDLRFYRVEQLSGTNLLTGDHVITTNGDEVLHPINHASLVMSWGSKLIYIDPVGGAAPYSGLPKADLILVTHSHGDHFHSPTLDAVRSPGVVIVAPPGVYSSMSTTLKGLTTVLTNGMATNVLDLRIEAVPAYNLTTSNHPRGAGNGYVLTLGGRRLYFSGDTEDIPEMRALQNIDVAFVCMNIPYTMTVEKAASAVRDFRPRVVFPYHYRNQNGTFADLELFKRLVGTDLGIEVRFRKWY
jgi:L-ascorbate metabolism protein UlaG (beta-lactamase superfamily)